MVDFESEQRSNLDVFSEVVVLRAREEVQRSVADIRERNFSLVTVIYINGIEHKVPVDELSGVIEAPNLEVNS